ncbi:MAG: hypothetical protein EOO68_00650 [Moraxellaceae bacterium]|nr:MAG: hypothetical protein EOO68_00650 [Moraxellaceae bacterium]
MLNPPLVPFGQALIQAGVDLERVIVVHITNKPDFLASFVELARSESCSVLLAWQQNYALSYAELRKCLLATNEGSGVRILFRSESAQQQSSPASLRILSEITATDIHLRIFKQKGVLQQRYSNPVKLPIPSEWKGLLPYHLLDQAGLPDKFENSSAKRKSATIMPLRRSKR